NFPKDFNIGRIARPSLQASCAVTRGAESVDGALRVEAGAQILVTCSVDNRGDGSANDTTLTASLDGGAKSSGTRTIPPGSKTSLDVLLQVPGEWSIDSEHNIVLHIDET